MDLFVDAQYRAKYFYSVGIGRTPTVNPESYGLGKELPEDFQELVMFYPYRGLWNHEYPNLHDPQVPASGRFSSPVRMIIATNKRSCVNAVARSTISRPMHDAARTAAVLVRVERDNDIPFGCWWRWLISPHIRQLNVWPRC